MSARIPGRAVVIGGSVAGLAAAATLASRSEEVVIIERRPLRDGASVAPHGHLPHVMLYAGARVLEALFPGFAEGLLARGAAGGGPDRTRTPCYWAAAGAVRRHLAVPDLGFPSAMCSRALVESAIRSATLDLPNVTALDGDAAGLWLSEAGRVAGVRLRESGEPLEADLVVDASGRAGRVEDWLRAARLEVPAVTEVVVGLRYTAYVVERRADDFGGGVFAVVQNSPAIPRIGVVLPMEGDRWQVILGGYFGEAAPTEPDGARAFASSLATPVLSPLFDRPYLEEPARYTFRSSRRRHWERLRRPPAGFCAIGDSFASFNPIYGQGMSAALLQAEALGVAVDACGAGPRLARAVAGSAAKVIDNPWLVATGGDFVYPATVGRRPRGSAAVNGYVERVARAAAVDESVNRALTGVQQLLAAPATLFRPSVAARVWRHGRAVPAPAAAPQRREPAGS